MLIIRNNIYWSLIIVAFFFIFPQKTFAQVIINELYTKGSSDWVELYVVESVDMTGWVLDDDGTVSNLEEFNQSYEAGDFITINVANRLNDTGDIVSLYSDTNDEIDNMSYGNKGGVCVAGENQSVGRVDNGNTIERFSSSSKNLTNIGMTLDPCPTPSPEPTTPPTQETAPDPTTAPTSRPTKTPTPKPTATKKPTIKPTSTSESDSSESGFVLSDVSIGDKNATPTPEGEVAGASTSKDFPFQAVGLILSGVGFMGYGGFSLYKRSKNQYNDGSEKII